MRRCQLCCAALMYLVVFFCMHACRIDGDMTTDSRTDRGREREGERGHTEDKWDGDTHTHRGRETGRQTDIQADRDRKNTAGRVLLYGVALTF